MSAEFDLLSTAAGGMDAQRAVLDIAARNVAAAQASTPGHPYPRLVAEIAAAAPDAGDGETDDDGDADLMPLVRTRSERGTGDALTEMIAVLDAQRAYEANASVFDVGKRLAERTLDVGRT
ncbi:MAG: flagellar basal body rod C-terminal domain-containing protein [Candidatus Velthaea sp.]